jgi:hypothetical protein
MLLKNIPTKWFYFTLKPNIKASTLKAQVQPADARKKRGDGIRQNLSPQKNKT